MGTMLQRNIKIKGAVVAEQSRLLLQEVHGLNLGGAKIFKRKISISFNTFSYLRPLTYLDQHLTNKEYSRRVIMHKGLLNGPIHRILQPLFSVREVACLHPIREQRRTYPPSLLSLREHEPHLLMWTSRCQKMCPIFNCNHVISIK